MKHQKDVLPLRFTIVAEPHEAHVDFSIYEIDCTDGGKIYWHKKDTFSHPNGVDKLEDAEIFLHGYVKWDGCSNWSFDEQERGMMLHACGRDDLFRFSKIMSICFDWTKEFIDNFEEE